MKNRNEQIFQSYRVRVLLLVILLITSFNFLSYAQTYKLSGVVKGGKGKTPVEFVMVALESNESWAVTDEKGNFVITKAPQGKTKLLFQCMGYVKKELELNVDKDIQGIEVILQEDNLKLDEVVVTAKKQSNEISSSFSIDRKTLEHAQVLNVSDVNSLLPGGKTQADKSLTSDKRIALRSESGEKGNATFGTAVEIDGVRLQNNSSTSETQGVDTRNVSSANIESVEVVTGMPSVEHGDLSNGIVKINTFKGKTPLIATLSAKPHTKQAAISKGFALGKGKGGLLNLSGEYARSISDLASPYTAYDRLGITANYTNSIKNSVGPLSYNIGFAGNLGGYDSKSDPDAFNETYTKKRDNTFRGNFGLKWLLNKSWITNLEASASVIYSDKLTKVNSNKSNASTQAFIHSTENGYFIATNYDKNPNAPVVLGPTGYWYELAYTDDKPLSYTAKLKGDLVNHYGNVTNRVMIGAELSGSGNMGKGLYYDDMRYAPTWRPYRYDELPFMNNFALYAEDKLTVAEIGESIFQFTGGLRADITSIKNSDYGTVGGLSPRFNAKYTFWENSDKLVNELSFNAGWGKAIKLPSFETLYPAPSYADKLAFAPGSLADGTTFYAYYTMPTTPIYNSDLKWQSSRQLEIGAEARVKGTKIYLTAFYNKTVNPYISTTIYTPYSYKQTDQRSLEGCVIPLANREYTIDQQTGIVTVNDMSGVYPSQQLSYTTMNTYKSNTMYTNGSDVKRSGIDWIVDFPQIPALKTSFRLDGNYYSYKGLEENLTAYCPVSSQSMSGEPYKYVGYYVGTYQVANGTMTRKLNMNLTVTTHVPKIRMIVSAKFETSLLNYSKNLSEWSGGDRSIILGQGSDNFGTTGDVNAGNQYVATYPLYYSTWDNPSEKIPFAEKLAWAKENDNALYNDLAKLITKSNTNYYFNPNRISAYYSANLSVTKEIGDFASLSFYATNFFNNMKLVHSSSNDKETSLYNSSYIPRFYYGLTLRIKI